MVIQHGIVPGNQIIPYFLVPMLACLNSERGRSSTSPSAGLHCGSAGHFVNALNYAAFVIMPDFNYCNYQIVFERTRETVVSVQYTSMQGAAARARVGMKLVVFDPVCNNAASKADEWVPLIPGTDGSWRWRCWHAIANELGTIDTDYLKNRSNASYPIAPDGHYVRDRETNKPTIWDETAGKAKTFDDPTIGEIALDGSFQVQGTEARPAWVLLKERFQEYPPEKAAPISGVPAKTIRRIATEFAQAAQIGATITIDGKEMPFRPVSTFNIRSAGTHKNGTQTLFAIDLLNHVVGAVNVPGGCATVSMSAMDIPQRTNRIWEPPVVPTAC